MSFSVDEMIVVFGVISLR